MPQSLSREGAKLTNDTGRPGRSAPLLVDAASWPIEPGSLAILTGVGIADRMVAAHFGVDASDVQSLRERYRLKARQTIADTPLGPMAEDLHADLHRLAERLGAASNYIEALRAKAGGTPGDGDLSGLIAKAARQLDDAIHQFQTLRQQIFAERRQTAQNGPVAGVPSTGGGMTAAVVFGPHDDPGRPTAARLRDQAAHCRHLADQAVSMEIASELEKLADDYDRDAGRLELAVTSERKAM